MPAVTSPAVELERLRREVAELTNVVRDLTIKNEWMRRVLYGPTSERRRPEQDHGAAVQQSFLTAPVDAGQTVAQATAAQAQREDRAQRKAQKNAKKGRGTDGQAKRKNGGGRTPVNRSLRLVEQVIAAPAAERVAADGTPLILLGFETAEREHYLAAEVVRLVIKREIWGLPDTRDVVTRASVPAAIVPKGKYSDAYIAEAMLRKYLHGIPFGKMVQDFQAMGSDLSDAELADLASRFARFLSPISAAIRAQVLAHPLVHIDETPLPTQDGGRYLWAWLGGTQAFFHSGGRGGKELRHVLGLPNPQDPPGATPPVRTMTRFAMSDGYQVYDTVLEEAGIRRLCCWTHGKRGFGLFEDHDPTAKAIADAIRVLYRIEHEADRAIAAAHASGEAATALRLQFRRERPDRISSPSAPSSTRPDRATPRARLHPQPLAGIHRLPGTRRPPDRQQRRRADHPPHRHRPEELAADRQRRRCPPCRRPLHRFRELPPHQGRAQSLPRPCHRRPARRRHRPGDPDARSTRPPLPTTTLRSAGRSRARKVSVTKKASSERYLGGAGTRHIGGYKEEGIDWRIPEQKPGVPAEGEPSAGQRSRLHHGQPRARHAVRCL
jgi:hypothetical protein